MLGRTSRERAYVVRAVRAELAAMHRSHGRFVSDLDIARLSAHVQRAGATDVPWLVASSLSMWPRPPWVEAVVGPYPASLELSNPEDTASLDEWGSSGTGT